jgi:hypothetical protein
MAGIVPSHQSKVPLAGPDRPGEPEVFSSRLLLNPNLAPSLPSPAVTSASFPRAMRLLIFARSTVDQWLPVASMNMRGNPAPLNVVKRPPDKFLSCRSFWNETLMVLPVAF